MIHYRLHVFFVFLLWNKNFMNTLGSHPNNLAWSGGPIHLECENSANVLKDYGQYVKDNVIAVKAVSFKDEIYIMTPRLKHGVLATLWLLVRGRNGVELQAFPELHAHSLGNCHGIQNAVDFYLDHLGHIWVLDSGVVNTMESPRCMCPPKVVSINLLQGKMTKHIDLSVLTEPTSLLQNIVVDYDILGKPFIYVSDTSRGAILVHDVSSSSEWSVLVCPPAAGLQLALVKRDPRHALLILVRIHHPGLLELDTAALRRKKSQIPLRVFDEHTKPVLLLGSYHRHVYLRHTECADVLSWDARKVYNASNLINIHSPGPQMTPTSVTADSLKHVLLVLDSNYGSTVHGNKATYHRITFIGQL